MAGADQTVPVGIRYEKYITVKEVIDHGKGSDPFMVAYSDLLEKINELSLVRRGRTSILCNLPRKR